MKNQRQPATVLISGSLAFFCVLAIYRSVIPSIGRSAAQVRQPDTEVEGRSSHAITATPEKRAPALRSEIRGAQEEERSTPGQDQPEVKLASLLSHGLAWHISDLSRWEEIDMYRRSLELGMESIVGFKPKDGARLAVKLSQARSVRMQQFLLVSLAILEYGDVDTYTEYFTQPGLEAATAFALGRCGGPQGIALIVEALGKPAMLLADRDNLYYGLGQAGVATLSTLLDATEARLLRGEDPTAFLPLTFLAGESAWGPLKELALGDRHVGIRIAAIRAYARGEEIHAGHSGWLQRLALDSELDLLVRAEALRALGHLDRDAGGTLVKEILNTPNSPSNLLSAALTAAIETGIPEGCLGQVDALARGTNDTLREKALIALISDGSIESSALLRGLLPLLSPKDVETLVTQLFVGGPLDRLESSENPLYEDVANLLTSELLSKSSEQLALQAFAEAGVLTELVDSVAWGRYADASMENRLNHSALFELSHVIGSEANQEILGAYRQTDGFVPKLELASLIANLEGNSDNAEVERFLADEVLPHFRTALSDQTGAMLAYTGPRRGQHNQLAMTMANVFGRYGNVEDIPYLDSIGPRFLEEHTDWPESLRSAIHTSLVEATGRATDLINLRQVQ